MEHANTSNTSGDRRQVTVSRADLDLTMQWLEQHGYTGGMLLHPSNPSMRATLAFGRPGQPLVGARMGDYLVWDGESVMVELRSEG